MRTRRVGNFDFDDDATAVVEFELEFDRAFRHLEGRFSGALYASDVDPLDPRGATPLATFQDEVDGRRVAVHHRAGVP